MNEPKKRTRNQEPRVKKSEVGRPKAEVESPMLRQAQHDKKDPEIKEILTTDNSQLTTNMEVHHHPEVEKKGFKEYLLEGLMIFLAVFMGFVAENIRENISEHKRAAEFARSYFEDIKKDTAALNAGYPF